ncbi:MAG: toll/interleukin-1 receptor domain-containing protein [Chloroflexota bacterium]
MSHVFVSYKRESLAEVTAIVDQLKRHHYVWFDQTGIPGGSHWENEITTALNDASCLILMVTQAAIESEWVQYEYTAAIESDVMVIPYILEKCTMPQELLGVQAIRAYQDDQSYEQLLKALPADSRIWGEVTVPKDAIQAAASLGEVYENNPDGCLTFHDKLVGIPIQLTTYCKVYRVGKLSDPLKPQQTYQLALQLTSRNFSLQADNGRYPQADFTESIARHLLKTPSDHIELYLIQGPLNQAHDNEARLGFGLNAQHASEWDDVIKAADYARGVATGRTMQLFINGPAILTYKLGMSNPGYTRYELYQLDYATQQYAKVLSG